MKKILLFIILILFVFSLSSFAGFDGIPARAYFMDDVNSANYDDGPFYKFKSPFLKKVDKAPEPRLETAPPIRSVAPKPPLKTAPPIRSVAPKPPLKPAMVSIPRRPYLPCENFSFDLPENIHGYEFFRCSPREPAIFIQKLKDLCNQYMPKVLHGTMRSVHRISFCEIVGWGGLADHSNNQIIINIHNRTPDIPMVRDLIHEVKHIFDLSDEGSIESSHICKNKRCIFNFEGAKTAWLETRARVTERLSIPDLPLKTPREIWHYVLRHYSGIPSRYEYHHFVTSSKWYNSKNLDDFFDPTLKISDDFTKTIHDLVHCY